MMTRNAIRCLKCGDVIESAHRHACIDCSCGNVTIDGGLDYRRMLGQGFLDASWEDLKEVYGELDPANPWSGHLSGLLRWSAGDGKAMERLVAALQQGRFPTTHRLTGRGLTWLANIALGVAERTEPPTSADLTAFAERLLDRVRQVPWEEDCC